MNLNKESIFIKRGILYNTIGFVVIALAGLVLNILIGRYYSSDELGVFNQAWAIYIFISQFSVWGIHLSLLNKTSLLDHNNSKLQLIITSGIYSTLIVSFLIFLIALIIVPIGLPYFNSSELNSAWRSCSWGLVFFSLNKSIFSILNGLKYMSKFAFLTTLRGIALIVVSMWLIHLDTKGAQMASVFAWSELIVFTVGIFYVVRYINFRKFYKYEIINHLSFGSKSFMGGTFIELNSRVDVLILGLMTTDRIVGLYSMAAFVYEGLSQFAIVLRNFVNPDLAKAMALKSKSEFYQLIKHYSLVSFIMFSLMAIVAWFIYPLYIEFVVANLIYLDSKPMLMIMLIGLVLASPLLPFNLLFIQSNQPMRFTIYQGLIILVNALVCILFINTYGGMGAAYGVAISIVFAQFLLVLMAKPILKELS